MQLQQVLALFAQLPQIVFNFTNPSESSSAVSSLSTPITTTTPVASFEASTEPETIVQSYQLDEIMAEQCQPKYMLPALPYKYDALEPYISKQIMELHHKKHHQAYVNNLNAALASLVKALAKNDIKQQIELQQVINFNGGGHINHSLFWTGLCSATSPAASPSSAPRLQAAIQKRWGSYDTFKETFSTTLLGIQGSGWGWLAKDGSGVLSIETTKDQDPVTGGKLPIFGVDMWEHAYYLQYYNDKASYVHGIWNIINWETAEKRFNDEAGSMKL
ncbi:Manganese/iron superoxide dismutase [Kalaharituber pfeilii]|nr:Manganese/iron superoxide dismutase [Kalaharituber pfeilii]